METREIETNHADSDYKDRTQAFIADLSHEIRAPLSAILGFSELLSDPDLDPIEREEIAVRVSRNGDHLTRLIDGLLDLSRVESGNLELEPTRFDLAQMLNDISSSLEVSAKPASVDLIVDTGPQPTEIVADEFRCKQILFNVIGNACKFTKSGSIRVQSSVRDHHDAKHRLVSVRISDTGMGISEKSRNDIFEPFARGDQRHKAQTEGTGLGLSLSRKLARLMGGDLRLIESAPNVGSTFELSFRAGQTDDLAASSREKSF